MSLHFAITGDIRNPESRKAILPHMKTGVVWEDKSMGDYEFKMVDGQLTIGPMAFQDIHEAFPNIPMTRKSDWN